MNDLITVAIIDDNDTVRKNVAQYISFSNDITLDFSSNSVEDALLSHRDRFEHIDGLILDIGLPGMTGIEGIPHFKKLNSDLDIIMLSAYEEEDKILKALCSGACSYISKSARLEEILNAVRVAKRGGSYMSPSIAREIVTYLLNGSATKKMNILTSRQQEIIDRMVKGKTYKTIAAELHISIETVRSHIKKMYKSLEVNNKAEAIALYLNGKI